MAGGYKPAWLAMGVLMAVVGCWLAFWEPGPFDESPAYALGPLLLASGSALAAVQFALRPRPEVESRTAPAETEAWLAVVYAGVLIAYLLLHAGVFTGSWWSGEARSASIKLLQFAVFHAVISALLRARRGRGVLEDERDRQIRHHAVTWGRGVLVAAVVVLAWTLGLSPADRLQWATPGTTGLLLVLALLLGWWVQAVVTVAQYWRDRHGVAA